MFIFTKHADASRLCISWLFGVNPKRELEFKIAITAGVQDIIYM